jgi:putative toxin-antitoxin system antitoxin component (TIGR02293 family)
MWRIFKCNMANGDDMSPAKKNPKTGTGSKVVVRTASEPASVYARAQAGLSPLSLDLYRQKAKGSQRVYGQALGMGFRDTRQLLSALKQGLSFEAFERLCAELQVNQARLAEVCGIATRTLARRRLEGRLQALESERVYRIAALFDRAKEVLGTCDEARRWLKESNRALAGAAPLEYAGTEIGAREVEDLLGRLEYGVFS